MRGADHPTGCPHSGHRSRSNGLGVVRKGLAYPGSSWGLSRPRTEWLAYAYHIPCGDVSGGGGQFQFSPNLYQNFNP